jgi:hypothetical protein
MVAVLVTVAVSARAKASPETSVAVTTEVAERGLTACLMIEAVVVAVAVRALVI